MSPGPIGSPRELRLLGEGYSFLEGPRWRDGRLYASDFYTNRVLAFDENGEVGTVCAVPGRPSGLGFSPQGDLLIVSMTDRRLLRLGDEGLVEVADLSAITGGDCNDMVIDAAGRAYVGNFGGDIDADPTIHATGLVLVEANGDARVVAEGLIFPNGATLSPEGDTLLISETFAARISAFDVGPDGSLANRRVWASFSDDSGSTVPEAVACGAPLPDGMALDAEGAVWIGDAAGNGALRVGEGGVVLDFVSTGDDAVYAVALGGVDRRTLFMCAAPPLLQSDLSAERRARLLSCQVDVPGAGRP